MNLRQPYEQLIAGKLRQLRPPDANASWQQMKRLLDEEDNKGAGGDKRPPGNNGWWRIGLLAIIVGASFWLYNESDRAPANAVVKNTAAVQPAGKGTANNTIASQKIKTGTIDNNTTLTDANNTSLTPADNHTKLANDLPAPVSAVKTAPNAAAAAKNVNSRKDVEGSSKRTNNNNPSLIVAGTTYGAPRSAIGASNNRNSFSIAPAHNNHEKYKLNNSGKNTAGEFCFSDQHGSRTTNPAPQKDNSLTENNNKTGTNGSSELLSETGQQTTLATVKNGKRKGNAAGQNGNDFSLENDAANDGGISRLKNPSTGQLPAAKQKTWFDRLTGMHTADPDPYTIAVTPGDSIETSRDAGELLNSETKKGVAKAQREAAIAVLDKKDKKFHLNLSNLFKPFSMRMDAEPWWAAGIALNAGVPAGAQSRFGYNMNAKTSTLTDYLPSPYLQYHVNNYVYFQTELNFITPQYTPQLLIYRSNSDITATGGGSGGVSQQKSIYIQKLYYFNWPVSLHYSPVSNLYFSGGIQFSSFQSGLAAIEDKQYTTSLGPDHSSAVNTTVLKFKDDSIAARISPNEWRWQLGAEYYWNRFSVGLRYNQAFKNAINTPASSTLPATINRNQSLLFSVRYNLFESKNKK